MRRLLAIVLATALLGACGGDGAAKPPTPGPTPTRAAVSEQDLAYAGAVCSAFGRYLNAFTAETQRDPQLFADQAKLLRVAGPILETFGRDLDRAKAPKDMANFHDALVQRVKTMAQKAKSGAVVSTAELADLSKGAPLPPTTVRDRLAEAANARPDCAQTGGMDALFGDPNR
jgi:hypothetical protein